MIGSYYIIERRFYEMVVYKKNCLSNGNLQKISFWFGLGDRVISFLSFGKMQVFKK